MSAVSGSAHKLRPIDRLLNIAVAAGAESAVRLHIARGESLEWRDARGFTPLMIAASRDRSAVCELLMDAGANIWASDPHGRDAFSIARDCGASAAAEVIAQRHANLDAGSPWAGEQEPGQGKTAQGKPSECEPRAVVGSDNPGEPKDHQSPAEAGDAIPAGYPPGEPENNFQVAELGVPYDTARSEPSVAKSAPAQIGREAEVRVHGVPKAATQTIEGRAMYHVR